MVLLWRYRKKVLALLPDIVVANISSAFNQDQAADDIEEELNGPPVPSDEESSSSSSSSGQDD